MKKYKASLIALGVLVLLGSMGIAKASPLGFWDKVAQLVAQQLSAKVEAPISSVKDQVFGSTQTASLNLVDTGSENSQGSLYLWDTQTGGGLETAGQAYLDATTTYGKLSSSVPGIDTAVFSGPLAAGTTTLFCRQNPFSATSTATFGLFSLTQNPTSSAYVSYVTSTTLFPVPTGITTSTASMIDDVVVLGGTASTTPYVVAGSVAAETVTATNGRITVAPNQAVCGIVKAGVGLGGTPSLNGWTNPTSILAGTYKIRFDR